MSAIVRSVGLTLALAACAKGGGGTQDAGKRVDELPRWATDKIAVKRELVRDLIEQGNTRLALDVLNELRTTDGQDDPELDLLQGIAMREEGLQSEADRLLSSARSKTPRDAEVHEAICVLRADQGQPEEAIASCQRAVDLDPERASAWNNLGFLQIAVGDYAGALTSLQHAVDVDAAEDRYRNNLALAQAANGRAADALRTFMSTAPRAVAHYNVGAALERFGSTQDALVYYSQALQYDPALATAREAFDRLSGAPEPAASPQSPSAPQEKK